MAKNNFNNYLNPAYYFKYFEKEYFLKAVTFMAVLLVFTLSFSVEAVDIGGELTFNTILNYQNDLKTNFNSDLELELLLPEENDLNLDTVFVLNANTIDQTSNFDFWLKKLNLSFNISSFQLQLGRQPISWSYGSLLNPIDYSLGAENLDQETRAKYLDGLELYYSLNWNTGFSFIITDSTAKENKWGLRARTLFNGFDLTANYIREPAAVSARNSIDQQHRLSATAKGDLGPFGVYGSLSSWQEDNGGEEINIYQIGSDYSHYFLAGSNLYLQGEFLRIRGNNNSRKSSNYLTNNLIRSIMPIMKSPINLFPIKNNQNSMEKNHDFLVFNFNYTANEFLNYGLTLVNYPADGSVTLLPSYNYTFSSNLILELGGIIPLNNEQKLLGSKSEVLTVGLSYTF